jgi:hypothetical protein
LEIARVGLRNEPFPRVRTRRRIHLRSLREAGGIGSAACHWDTLGRGPHVFCHSVARYVGGTIGGAITEQYTLTLISHGRYKSIGTARDSTIVSYKGRRRAITYAVVGSRRKQALVERASQNR